MCTILLPKARQTLVMPWSNRKPFPFTPWIPASKVKEVQFLTKVTDGTGAFDLGPAYQTANDIASPDSMLSVSGVTYTQDGIFTTGVVDFSSITDGKYFIRFGVAGSHPTSGTGIATVTLRVSARD